MFFGRRRRNLKQKRRRKPVREDKPMAYISFIAVLFGAAGVVGGIETGNRVGTIVAALIHIGGVIAMELAVHKEEDGGD